MGKSVVRCIDYNAVLHSGMHRSRVYQHKAEPLSIPSELGSSLETACGGLNKNGRRQRLLYLSLSHLEVEQFERIRQTRRGGLVGVSVALMEEVCLWV